HQLFGRLQRHVRAVAFPDFREDPFLRLLHALDHLLTAGAARKLVGLRQQRALARNLAHRAREDVVLGQLGQDLLGRQALRNRDGVLHDLAFDDGGDDVAQARVLLEGIFAGLEIGTGLHREHAADEQPRIDVDHAFTLQDVGDIALAGPRRYVHDLVFLERACRFQDLPAIIISDAGADQRQQHDRDDGVADHNKGIAGSIGTLGRRRDLFGLQRGTRAAGRNGRPFTHRCNLSPVALVPTFRSSYTISATTFYELRKAMGTSKLYGSSAAFRFEVPGFISRLAVQGLQIGGTRA